MLGDVSLLPGRSMKASDVQEADVLLVRSVTQVNEALLNSSKIGFVGTCTIGTDHLDHAYLDNRGITYSAAPGCNAMGVVQYVFSALSHLQKLDNSLKIAIIGCGNVGGRLYRRVKQLGFNCVVVDPHRSKSEIEDLCPFDEIYECDIICMHTPLVRDGQYPTEALIGYEELKRLKAGALLLNAGRGECIDNEALLKYLQTNDDLQVVLDVWAEEPAINVDLFEKVTLGTPHIAGYSYEGRANGSLMIFEALCSYLNKDTHWVSEKIIDIKEQFYGQRECTDFMDLDSFIKYSYDISRDHEDLSLVLDELPSSFDQLRKKYRKRREFSHYLNSIPLSERDGLPDNVASVFGIN